jgi:Integrase core domain
VQRFHQTLMKWLLRQPAAATLSELQVLLDRFGKYYNAHRPHRALGRRTPREAFEARPKATPSGNGMVLPAHLRVRRDRVDKVGRVTLRYNSRLHHIGLGRSYIGKRVLLLVADLQVRVITEDGELLRELTLDPSRDYQGR